MFGMVMTYSIEIVRAMTFRKVDGAPPSSGLPSRVTRFSPSITVATLLPRNLDLGLSSPMILTRLTGEM